MKVRIGYGIGAAPKLFATPDGLGGVVDDLERLGYDSLWFPERVNSAQLDPVVAMAFVAGRTRRIKFGSAVSVVPGRNPVLLAKALASLDQISGGRCLPAVGLGIANTAEQQAFGVERSERAPWLNEALPLMRRLWTEDVVDHDGERFSLRDARVLPKPVQEPFEIWMGGQAPSELKRTGRLADGWLASFTTPRHVAEGIEMIEQAAAGVGRRMDPEHYGVLIPYTPKADPALLDQLAKRVSARRPDAHVEEVVATSHARLVDMIEAFLAAGASKFVLFVVGEPDDWTHELEAAAATVLALQGDSAANP